jgi:ribosomal protein S18 acetylase RimI-like enzyme
MGEYVAAIWGWDETEQREYHAHAFDPSQWQIITTGQAAAGVVSVEYRPTEIYLDRLEIDPGYQSRGIGTLIIQHLLEQAAERGQPVTLDVLAVNARAHQLYKRLGFTEAERHGTANAKIRMSAAPSRTHDS